MIADYAGPDLLRTRSQAARFALRDRVAAEMVAALRQTGDTCTAPDGIAYTLTNQAQLDLPARRDCAGGRRLRGVGRGVRFPLGAVKEIANALEQGDQITKPG